MKRRHDRVAVVLIALMIGFLFVDVVYASESKPGQKIAIFPFENFSGDRNAPAVIMPKLRSRLEEKGYEVLKEDQMNGFLLKERVRTAGYISKETAKKIGEELRVQVILTGSVNSFVEGENPHAGFTAFVVNASDGSLAWANHAAATAEDFEKILGLGKIDGLDKLSEKVLDSLLKTLQISLSKRPSESAYIVAVMPFQNKCRSGDAGMMTTYMFIAELFKSRKFTPLEYGEVRRLVVDLRMKDKGEINLKNAEAVAGSAGVDGIVVGCIDAYREGSGISVPPEVEISARLINARKGKILWSRSSQVKGDDGVIMLDWGRIWSPENVAYKAITKLVKDMENTKWR